MFNCMNFFLLFLGKGFKLAQIYVKDKSAALMGPHLSTAGREGSKLSRTNEKLECSDPKKYPKKMRSALVCTISWQSLLINPMRFKLLRSFTLRVICIQWHLESTPKIFCFFYSVWLWHTNGRKNSCMWECCEYGCCFCQRWIFKRIYNPKYTDKL